MNLEEIIDDFLKVIQSDLYLSKIVVVLCCETLEFFKHSITIQIIITHYHSKMKFIFSFVQDKISRST